MRGLQLPRVAGFSVAVGEPLRIGSAAWHRHSRGQGQESQAERA